MAYTIEGKFNSYSFEDDVPLETAVEVVKIKDAPASTKEVVASIPPAVKARLASTFGGVKTALGDVLQIPEWTEEAKGAQREIEAHLQEVTPKNMTLGQEILHTAGVSVPSVLPYLAGGAIMGGARLGAAGLSGFATPAMIKDALKFGAEAALRGMAAGEGFAKYGELRADDFSPMRSATHAAIQAAAEYFPEKLPMKTLLDAGKDITLKTIGKALGRDIVGEEITTLIEDLNAKYSNNPNLTLKDYLEHAAITAGSSVIGGPLQVGVAATPAVLLSKTATRNIQKDLPQVAPLESSVPTPPEDIVVEQEPSPISGFTPKELRQTGYVLDEGGELTPEFVRNQTPALLPFEQRLDLLRKELATPPGPTATAEDLIAKRVRIAELRTSLSNELVTDPTQRRHLIEADTELGLIMPTWGAQVEVIESGIRDGLTEAMLRGEATDTSLQPAVNLRPNKHFYDYLDKNYKAYPSQEGLVPHQRQAYSVAALEGFTNAYEQHLNNANMSVAYSTDPTVQTFTQAVKHSRPGTVTLMSNNTSQFSPEDTLHLTKMLESWLHKFLPNKRLVVAATAAPKDFNKNAGVKTFHALLANDTSLIPLPFKGDMVNAFSLLAHEFSHAIVANEFEHASPQTKAALLDEYYTALKDGITMPAKEFFEKYFAPSRAAGFMRFAKPRDTGAQAYARLVGISVPNDTRNYFLSFDEFLAESGAKYFMSRGGFTPEAESFLKKIIKTLADFFKTLTAQQIVPSQSLAKWFDTLAARSGPLPTGPVQELKAQLLAAGVHRDIVNALEEPGSRGFDTETARSLLGRVTKDPNTLTQLQQNEYNAWVAQAKIRDAIDSLVSVNVSPKTLHKILRTELDPTVHKTLLEDIWQQPEFRGRLRVNKYEVLNWLYKHLAPLAIVPGSHAQTYHVMTKGSNMVVTTIKASSSPTDSDTAVWQTAVDPHVQPTYHNYATISQPFDQALPEVRDAVKTAFMYEAARRGYRYVQYEHNVREEIPLWLYPSDYAPGEGASFALSLDGLLQQLHIKDPTMRELPRDVVKFNAVIGQALGAFQIAKLNKHVPGVEAFRQGLRNSMMYRAEWLRPADNVIEQWVYKLPREEAATVSRLLFDEARLADKAVTPHQLAASWFSTQVSDPDNPNAYIFHLRPEIVKRYKLSERGQEIYSQVRNFYMQGLNEMERVGLLEMAKLTFKDPVVVYTLQEAMRNKATTIELRTIIEAFASKNPILFERLTKDMNELQEQFAALRAKPYTPYPRFGRWAVMVKDKQTGKVLYFSTHASQAEQHRDYSEVKVKYSNDAVSLTYMEDVPYALQGMPPKLLDALRERLNLTDEQVEAYKALLKDLTSSHAFINRMKKRKGIEGFTEDAISGFADYARRFANHIGRIKADFELRDALQQLEKYIHDLESAGNASAVNARRLHEWLEQTRQYLRNPGHELGELKSLVTAFYLAGNVSSVALNALQVPLVTLPYLSKRFGTARTFKELTQAYKDVVQSWGRLERLSPDEQAMFDHGLSSYFLEESYATTLAQIQDGGALQRAQPLTHARRSLVTFNHYAMLPFSTMEGLNRRVTLLTAYRLARRQNFVGAFDRDAYDFGREAVEDTQNEYAIENRPMFMRGNKSLIFQFMHYSQNMIFQMFGGDESWKRLLLTQLAIAGFMGLPFAENLADILKFLAKKWGIDFEPEYEARKYLEDLNLNADLILRGLLSDVFGFDLSRRVSLGEVIPGIKAVASNRKFNDALYHAVGDVGGAGISILMNLLKFVGDESPDTWKRWQNIMPSAIRNVMSAVDAAQTGGVTDRKGALLAGTDTFDLIGMSLGFMPEQVSKKYQSVSTTQEIANYWTHRREVLLDMWVHMHVDRNSSREGVADILKRVYEYNAHAPDAKLKITGDTLRRAVQNALKARTMREAGLGTNAQTRTITRAVESVFQE